MKRFGVSLLVVVVGGLLLGPVASLPGATVAGFDGLATGGRDAGAGAAGAVQPTPPSGQFDVPAAARVGRAAGSPARSDGGGPGSDVVHGRLAFWRLPGEPGVVVVRATFRLPSNVTAFSIRVPETARVEGTRGFDREGRRLVRSGDAGVSPRVTFTVAVNRSSRFGGLNFADAGDWALVRAPPLQPRWRSRGRSLSYRQTLTVADGDGYAGRYIAYLGDHDVVRSGNVTVVVPAAASPRVPPTAVARSLSATGTLLDVGAAGRTTTFVAPDTIRTGGQQLAGDDGPEDLRVSATSKLRHPDSTYRHEYLHTRQAFEVTAGMDWFVEASAEYGTALLGLYHGDYGFRRFHRFVNESEHAEAVLVDGSGDWARKDYAKGKRMLAALDAKVRRLTDHQRTVFDVWRRMNAREDAIDYREFKAVVAAVAGQRLDAWLDRHLAGSATPRVPANATAFAPVDADVEDGDGLPVDAEVDLGTNPYVADTDGDGTPDGTDASPAGTPTGAGGDGGATDAGDGPTGIPTPGFGPVVALVAVVIVALSGGRGRTS